jgi:hypothetical protein
MPARLGTYWKAIVTALVGGLAAASCAGSVAPAAPEVGAGGDAGGTVPDAAGNPIPRDAEAGPPPSDADSGAACPTRSGYFRCGANVCGRAVQACNDGACEWYGAIAPSCGACPTCACLNAETLLNIGTCQDDGAGGVSFTLRGPGGDGDPCKQDSDCFDALCQSGACECKPAGATAQSRSGRSDCCSGWEVGGACAAQASSPCITRLPDCYGGTCTSGTCACVGPGGYCNADRDCCASATRCVQGQCR